MNNKRWWATACILGISAVILGAFGAHGLKNFIAKEGLPIERLDIYNTGIKYHFYHTFALIAALISPISGKMKKIASLCFLVGIVFFSGSLYLLTIREFSPIPTAITGPITPVGGIFFIAGWVVMLLGIFNTKEK